jgi:hypothetical protein
MRILPDVAKDLVRAGANLVIEESPHLPGTLRELVLLAKASGATITIRRTKLLPDVMRDLARIGGNRVTFHC